MLVGSRDCTKLVAGVHKQTDLVGQVLARHGAIDVPIKGMLCFVEVDWPMIGGAFTIAGVQSLWPKALRKQLLQPGPIDEAQVRDFHRNLAAAFPPA